MQLIPPMLWFWTTLALSVHHFKREMVLRVLLLGVHLANLTPLILLLRLFFFICISWYLKRVVINLHAWFVLAFVGGLALGSWTFLLFLLWSSFPRALGHPANGVSDRLYSLLKVVLLFNCRIVHYSLWDGGQLSFVKWLNVQDYWISRRWIEGVVLFYADCLEWLYLVHVLLHTFLKCASLFLGQ